MAVTLKQLGRENGERRLAVLGAMKELGEESDALHAALAEPLCASHVNFAILVGPELAPLAEQLEGKVGFAHITAADEAAQRLKSDLRRTARRREGKESESRLNMGGARS